MMASDAVIDIEPGKSGEILTGDGWACKECKENKNNYCLLHLTYRHNLGEHSDFIREGDSTCDVYVHPCDEECKRDFKI